MKNGKTLRIGIDIGGTFTDLVAVDTARHEMFLGKAPSTPQDFSAGVADVLDSVTGDYGDIALFIHGTTAPLNAFLERKGARTALLTTKGFGDVYVMRRGNRVRMYDLQYRNPEPLVPRHLTFEVDERIDARGNVLAAPSAQELQRVLGELRRNRVESVAICFINSYLNDAHERQVAAFLQENAPELFVSPSTDVCREWREFERTSTAVINAYISPILKRYLEKLAAALREKGFDRRIFLMQSNGGLISAEEARSRALLTLMSGPIGASVGSRVLSKRIGEPNLICIDMGGTSFEVSLVVEGREAVVSETEVEGFPVLTSLVDIHSIGAGGGSIAWNDAGALRVGPQSAGAEPGPACYGRGGDRVTVTDANVVLGRIDPEGFLGGRMKLDAARAESAVGKLAAEFDMTPASMAEGVLNVINAKMANAIRTMTISKGIDPRDFALIAFGGAGPMHAAFIARELGIRKIIVPEVAGAFSAWGMLTSDIRHDASRALNTRLDAVDWSGAARAFGQMESELATLMSGEGVPDDGVAFRRYLDVRYLGQEYFVSVGLDREEPLGSASAARVAKRFHALYQQTYGHSNPDESLEIANLRVEARGVISTDRTEQTAPLQPGREGARDSRTRQVFFFGQDRETRFVHRSRLTQGETLAGPAIIEETACTTIVPPGYTVCLDTNRNLIIEKRAGE